MISYRYLLVTAMLFQNLAVSAYEVGPVNPKFTKWQNTNRSYDASNLLILQTTEGEKVTGWIPSPIREEVHTHQTDVMILGAEDYPTRFDLSDPNLDLNRNDSSLTAITNQAECGVCWAFAAYGAYEGSVSADNQGVYDFSEQHLRYQNGSTLTNNDPCSGGNLPMVTSYLARGAGPVSEASDPYDLSSDNSSNADAEPIRYVDNIIEVPLRDIDNKRDIDYLKDIIQNKHKPLYVSIQVGNGTAGETGESVWDDDSTSYFCQKDSDGNGCNPNHAVVIVGWDDDYEAQGQTGAFIVRNSWGADWGQNGYFYVPYNDESIALNGTIAYFDDKPDYELGINKIYQHDSLASVYDWGDSGDTPMWEANRYTIEEDGKVKAIGFYAIHANTSYEIRLFKAIDGEGDDVVFSNPVGTSQVSSSPVARGWHTIVLDTPVDVKKGETLIAQIKLSNPVGWPLSVEGDVDGYVDAEFSPGESYWSTDGDTFEDVDNLMKDYIPDPNFAIKVLVETSKEKEYSGDFNGDGVSDVLLQRKTDGNIYTLLLNSDGTSASLNKIASNLEESTWSIVNIADFNGDGVSDVLLQRKTDGNIYTLLLNSDGTSASLNKIASNLDESTWSILY